VSTHAGLIVALFVGIPLVLVVGHHFGSGWSFAAGLAVAAVMNLIVPHIPHSPIACVDIRQGAGCTGSQMDWVGGLCMVAPLFTVLAVKKVKYRNSPRR
jgi:hypothetical protein